MNNIDFIKLNLGHCKWNQEGDTLSLLTSCCNGDPRILTWIQVYWTYCSTYSNTDMSFWQFTNTVLVVHQFMQQQKTESCDRGGDLCKQIEQDIQTVLRIKNSSDIVQNVKAHVDANLSTIKSMNTVSLHPAAKKNLDDMIREVKSRSDMYSMEINRLYDLLTCKRTLSASIDLKLFETFVSENIGIVPALSALGNKYHMLTVDNYRYYRIVFGLVDFTHTGYNRVTI